MQYLACIVAFFLGEVNIIIYIYYLIFIQDKKNQTLVTLKIQIFN